MAKAVPSIIIQLIETLLLLRLAAIVINSFWRRNNCKKILFW
jgi:hypothetical protein